MEILVFNPQANQDARWSFWLGYGFKQICQRHQRWF